MQRILIADDERPIREWIEQCIRRRFPGRFAIDAAANGAQAWELFERNRPDAVLADIKMPLLDGLTLAERIRRDSPETAIAIITSHADFGFARAALKQDIRDYVLKTEITEELLAELIEKLLRTDGAASPARASLLSLEGCDIAALSPDELCGLVEASGQPLPPAPYFAVGVRAEDNRRPTLIVAHQTQVLPVFEAQADYRTLLKCCRLRVAPSALLEFQTIFAFVSALRHENPGLLFSATHACRSLAELPCALADAARMLDLSFYGGSGVYLQPTAPADCGDALAARYAEVKRALGTNAPAATAAALGEFFEFLQEHTPPDLEYVRVLCRKLCERALRLQSYGGADALDRGDADVDRTLRACKTLSALRAQVCEMFGPLIRTEPPGAACSPPIRKALAYLRDHYESVRGLSEVAQAVYLNPEYFSRLFKEEVGQGFTSYLNELRLSEAVRLMQETDLKIFEIAERVGFSNLSYFSRRFKMRYGFNPQSYRRQEP